MPPSPQRLLWINVAFWTALLLLAGPDFMVLSSELSTATLGAKLLLLAGTALDALLFTSAFIMFRLELSERTRAQAALARANEDLERANRELAEANEMKTRFLHIAAHDLRNPLNAIFQLTDLLHESTADPEVPEAAEVIARCSRDMIDIVEDLLEIAALQSGRSTLSRSDTDISELAAAVVTRNLLHAKQKHVALQFESDGDCRALIDPRAITRAIDNLVSNAVKFSPAGKSVHVVTTRHEQTVSIRVSDEGPGLSADDKRQLFQPFQRLSAQPTAGEKSTGLGLSIVKGWIEAHGGRIWAESAGQGRGATFVAELPVAVQDEPAAEGAAVRCLPMPLPFPQSAAARA